MLDKLIDIIIIAWEHIWFIKIINENERGILLRFGKLKKQLSSGMVFKIPFIDQVLIQYVKDDTILLPSQKLTTKDGKTITVTGMILYNVDDVVPFILNASVPTQSITDVAQGSIAEMILSMTYEEIVESLEKLSNEISKSVRRDCKHWGAKIQYVKLTDITVSRTFNVFKNSDSHL